MGNESAFMSLAIEDKLLQFASFLSHMRKDLRLGGLVGIYILLQQNHVGEEIKRVIIEELFTCLTEYELQEEVFLVCTLEAIGMIGPNEKSISRLGILKSLLCEPTLKHLQLHCFCAMMKLGYAGLHAVLDICSKDYNSLQSFLLYHLL